MTMMKRLATLGLAVLLSAGMEAWAETQDPAPKKESKDSKGPAGKGKRASIEVLISVTGDGTAIPNEAVTATFADRPPMNERTNGQGIASFTLLDASTGSLHVLLTVHGWETFARDYDVAAPEKRIDIQLKRRGVAAGDRPSR
jgi:hypothetical protein